MLSIVVHGCFLKPWVWNKVKNGHSKMMIFLKHSSKRVWNGCPPFLTRGFRKHPHAFTNKYKCFRWYVIQSINADPSFILVGQCFHNNQKHIQIVSDRNPRWHRITTRNSFSPMIIYYHKSFLSLPSASTFYHFLLLSKESWVSPLPPTNNSFTTIPGPLYNDLDLAGLSSYVQSLTRSP